MPTTALSLSRDEFELLEKLLWMDGPSRHELAARTGHSKSKIASLVAHLLDDGWLEEGESQESSGGRRPTSLHLSHQLGFIVGIDLGATSVDVVLCDVNLTVLGTRTAATSVSLGPGPVLAQIGGLLDDLLTCHGVPPEGVFGLGMGVPGPVEFRTGLLINPPLMPRWEGFNLREHFAALFEAPLAVDNDVNLMALGELHHVRQRGLGTDLENFLVVKLGTGIGCGIIARGDVFRGADGAAGDIGHICVDPDGPRCYCGNPGCLEALAGAPHIAREAAQAVESGASPILADLARQHGELGTREVAQAARLGDPVANHIVQTAGSRVGQVLAGLVNFFNPSQILLGGGVAHMGPLMLASVRQSVYARSLPLSTRKLRIDYTHLQDASGRRGAAVLALRHALTVQAGLRGEA
ncbi:ROK family transcriptional regulator (plasmid) [Deinococcus metallilatus]|uniref:Glucokinase-like ROK family protein n=1 Tax=Deinococcus metallilatus TaxID=1211322 RepID=A0AAJ5FC98_9DEIO|nr:ROK family transcriptional regulator [Deinococcus metallilatus]MBB5293480.1 glucokinase-like ROK family protein [Deinococcus metallilatus]QBY06563.1 ROK family transcriptional regulator [Deinococcus metallilatus]RXJ17906.1 ROK family transcriptional regulator [Deinococcus metallilatus]TLK32178.1 ROK family transcriptional regulator [Deinococcus metallilatus]GMA15300.1 sugar kinase [Deinococcus metallilatus]